MKKLSAILLILLLAFHWYGFRLVVNHYQRVADRQLEARLDASDYSDSQLIEISTPLNMPYQASNTEFERCYGEIIIEGVVHTFVKRKIENGILVLKCIPNEGKQAMKNASTMFFRDNNGLDDQRNSRQNTPLAKVFKNVFCDCENYFQVFDLNRLTGVQQKIFTPTPAIGSANLPVAEQPPDRVC